MVDPCEILGRFWIKIELSYHGSDSHRGALKISALSEPKIFVIKNKNRTVSSSIFDGGHIVEAVRTALANLAGDFNGTPVHAGPRPT